MNNYYFIRYASKESLKKALKKRNLIQVIDGEEVTVNGTSIDYIGEIPTEFNEEGEPTKWDTGYHCNIVTNKELNFSSNEKHPSNPIRVFGGFNNTIQEIDDILE